jgi:hypothetical protein
MDMDWFRWMKGKYRKVIPGAAFFVQSAWASSSLCGRFRDAALFPPVEQATALPLQERSACHIDIALRQLRNYLEFSRNVLALP